MIWTRFTSTTSRHEVYCSLNHYELIWSNQLRSYVTAFSRYSGLKLLKKIGVLNHLHIASGVHGHQSSWKRRKSKRQTFWHRINISTRFRALHYHGTEFLHYDSVDSKKHVSDTLCSVIFSCTTVKFTESRDSGHCMGLLLFFIVLLLFSELTVTIKLLELKSMQSYFF